MFADAGQKPSPAHTDHRPPADDQMVEEFHFQRPRYRSEMPRRGDVRRARPGIARRVVMHKNEARGASPENPLEQRTIASPDRGRAPLDAGGLRHQQSVPVMKKLDHDFAAQSADVLHEDFEKSRGRRPDDAGTRDQFCHDGSAPRRFSLIMCDIVPSTSAARTRKVGAPRIRA